MDDILPTTLHVFRYGTQYYSVLRDARTQETKVRSRYFNAKDEAVSYAKAWAENAGWYIRREIDWESLKSTPSSLTLN